MVLGFVSGKVRENNYRRMLYLAGSSSIFPFYILILNTLAPRHNPCLLEYFPRFCLHPVNEVCKFENEETDISKMFKSAILQTLSEWYWTGQPGRTSLPCLLPSSCKPGRVGQFFLFSNWEGLVQLFWYPKSGRMGYIFQAQVQTVRFANLEIEQTRGAGWARTVKHDTWLETN